MNNIKTINPTHPGEVIKEELSVRGISQKRFAEQVGLSYKNLKGILNGENPLTERIASTISSSLGISQDTIINMYNNYKKLCN